MDDSKIRADDSIPSDMKKGLTDAEAKERLQRYGFNEVPEKKTNPVVMLARKFWGLTAWMLEIIIVLSWVLQKYADVYIVTGLLLFNAALSFIEERRASSAVDALKEKLRVNARVLRDGAWRAIPARELVPGDMVRIRLGDFVPADVKIQDRLEVDQSALTGESQIVEKKRDDLLYSGSIVRSGESNGTVVSTGVKTYFGRTVQLVQLARPKLHIEEVVSNVVKWLLIVVTALAAVALVFSASLSFNLLDVLPIVSVLLLSAIPVALPAMFTTSLAIGSRELAKKDVLVTRLSAVEDAATMNVLCVDKTGTVTMNRLSIATVLPLNGFTEKEVILFGALASQEANRDPIDLAFIESAKRENLIDETVVQKNFVPFDPKTRRTEATVQKGGTEFKVVKGAVRAIAEVCGLDGNATDKLEQQLTEFALKGYRTLAVAKADAQGKLNLVGLSTLYDMPRPDSKQLIQELNDLGVPVKMLTGDALPIAKETAANIGLGENVISASTLKELIKENSLEAAEAAEKSAGFAEIYPEDKYTIVKSLQAERHVVGMTGDGVNDAPALRQAEVGIAVSSATDVAKGAASVVLTSEGLIGIVGLVQNGRVIYERITAWIFSKIVRTLQIAVFVVLSFLLTQTYVVSAFAVVLYFFLTDFVKISLSTDNLCWSRKPDTWNINGAVKASLALGSLAIAESFALLYIGLRFFRIGLNDPALYTLTFEVLFYSAIFLIFNVRERGHFWNSRPSKVLFASVVGSIIIATAIVTLGIPNLKALPLTYTLIVLLLSVTFSLAINDSVKAYLVSSGKVGW
ncbi:MAG TPA: plasma-membrane proton-efflux P-type ATPase [Candidatus Bathyarchaeia archaeon]|nr:plasma-membrane proton-efflux P-type ATPase [Candidatus Bathyarchaeia archaeon]